MTMTQKEVEEAIRALRMEVSELRVIAKRNLAAFDALLSVATAEFAADMPREVQGVLAAARAQLHADAKVVDRG